MSVNMTIWFFFYKAAVEHLLANERNEFVVDVFNQLIDASIFWMFLYMTIAFQAHVRKSFWLCDVVNKSSTENAYQTLVAMVTKINRQAIPTTVYCSLNLVKWIWLHTKTTLSGWFLSSWLLRMCCAKWSWIWGRKVKAEAEQWSRNCSSLNDH